MWISLRFLFTLTLLLLMLASPKLIFSGQNVGTTVTVTGEIMDSLCANNRSHESMMKEMKSMGHDKATCTVKCIELGAKFVLYDATQGIVYALEKQEAVEKFAGRNVRITGALEKKKKIKVANIEAVD